MQPMVFCYQYNMAPSTELYGPKTRPQPDFQRWDFDCKNKVTKTSFVRLFLLYMKQNMHW